MSVERWYRRVIGTRDVRVGRVRTRVKWAGVVCGFEKEVLDVVKSSDELEVFWKRDEC